MVFALVRQKDHKVIVKFENAPQSDADIESYLDEMRRVYKINNKFVVLYDCTDMYMTKISWKHIMMQANFMRAQEDATRNLMVRAAIVVNSDWARAILKTLFKVRKTMVPPPRGQVELRGPIVVVFGVPSHVHHGVDGGRTTHDFATGQFNVAMAGVRFGFGVVVPIDGGVFEDGVDPGRNVDHRVPIPWPGFDQEDGDSGVFGETICQDTPGGACTHDDVVVGGTGGGGGGGGGEEAPLDRREH